MAANQDELSTTPLRENSITPVEVRKGDDGLTYTLLDEDPDRPRTMDDLLRERPEGTTMRVTQRHVAFVNPDGSIESAYRAVYTSGEDLYRPDGDVTLEELAQDIDHGEGELFCPDAEGNGYVGGDMERQFDREYQDSLRPDNGTPYGPGVKNRGPVSLGE